VIVYKCWKTLISLYIWNLVNLVKSENETVISLCVVLYTSLFLTSFCFVLISHSSLKVDVKYYMFNFIKTVNCIILWWLS
jgi:hypothetical protein